MSTRIEPIIARLHDLHPRLIDLSLERLQRLLAQLGHPERRLPPILHVAGTNGKGSTCAMLRAMAEAAGWRVHVYTSPHLVRFNERFRVAGHLVTDDALVEAFEHIERVNAGAPITVFEVITAVAFHLFASTPADLCILEVGLGGRGDATNVIESPAACAITSLSLDHREMLGDTIEAIAAEKAGIIKPGIPVITGQQPKAALDTLRRIAAERGSPLLARDEAWTITQTETGLRFTDAAGTIDLPNPSLPGPHQIDNAGIAIATLRTAFPLPPSLGQGGAGGGFEKPAENKLLPQAQSPELTAATHPYPSLEGRGIKNVPSRPPLPASAYPGIAQAQWPARLQRLTGALAAMLPPDWELWLDGGHNPGAGEVLARHLATWSGRPLHLLVGMKQSKDAAEFLRPLLPFATTLWAIEEEGQHQAVPVAGIIAASGGVARPGPNAAAALRQLPAGPPARVLICGSLYLAGEILKQDGTIPT